MSLITVSVEGSKQTVDVQPVAPSPTGNFIGSDSDLASKMDMLWGGPGSGAWLTTKLPDNTSIDTRSPVASGPAGANRSEQAVATLVAYTTGPLPPGAPGPLFPTVNINAWTSTVCIVPYPFPLTAITPYGTRVGQPWFDNSRGAIMKAGIPIPQSLVPTWGTKGDTDSEVTILQPDWVWPRRPADPQYHGRSWELFGLRNPAQSAAAGGLGNWDAKDLARCGGTNNRLTGRSVFRTAGADYFDATYPGYSADGVGEDGHGCGVVVARCPNPWTMVTCRDLIRGVIDHPLGFALPQDPNPANRNAHPSVWPATGYYDASSRPWMPEGSRLRLPAGTNTGSLSIQPLGPGQRRTFAEVMQICNTAIRDYGLVFYDTTGTVGVDMRFELGSPAYLPANFSGNAFIKSLMWPKLQLMVVGSDSNPNP